MNLQIRQASFALGAEIIGIDLRKPLDEKSFNEIHDAFLKHLILFFREQPITAGQQVAFMRWFGEVDKNIGSGPRFVHPEHREIQWIRNPKSVSGNKSDPYQGEHWHSDRSVTCNPTAITMLHAIEIPQVGGDTIFANMYLSYETLSDGMKKLVEGLEAVHLGGEAAQRVERGQGTIAVAQPVVKIHPETGRKALYFAEFPKIVKFVGMTLEESKPLIQFLCNHATRHQFCYRHQWRKDDVVMWDNRCLMHNALGDYDRSQTRDMERSTVIGTPSGYVYDGPLEYVGPHY